jgi:protein O-GlcNAc transferase
MSCKNLMRRIGTRRAREPALPTLAAIDALESRHGIARDRVIFAPRAARGDYLAGYHTCDIALDSFPYNGHTTTCDALWMGVPVVSLVGRTHVSRAGLSVLSAAGLRELTTRTGEEYVRAAVGLASDLPKLVALRQGLRRRVECSPLRDGVSLARRVEQAYQNLWRQWCSGPVRDGAT